MARSKRSPVSKSAEEADERSRGEGASGPIDLKSIIGKLERSHELLREAGDMEGQRLRQFLLVNEELARDMIQAELEVERAGKRQKDLLRELGDLEERFERIGPEREELESSRAALTERVEREEAQVLELRAQVAEKEKTLSGLEREIAPLRKENTDLEQRILEAESVLDRLRRFRDQHREELEKHLADIEENTERSASEDNV